VVGGFNFLVTLLQLFGHILRQGPLANIWNPAVSRKNLLWVINGHPDAVLLFV
jgi:hypothetical protein